MIKTIQRIALALTLSITISGCAGFAGKRLPEVSTQSVQTSAATTKAPFAFTYQFGKANFGDNLEYTTVNAVDLNSDYVKVFLESLRQSGHFDQAKTNADLKIDVRLIEVADPNAIIGAMITGFSIYTIPSWMTIEQHFLVKVTHKGKVFNYALVDEMTFVQWLPMALLYPFNNPFKQVPQAIQSNAWNNLITKMKADGIIGS
jgi:hypothetical protein